MKTFVIIALCSLFGLGAIWLGFYVSNQEARDPYAQLESTIRAEYEKQGWTVTDVQMHPMIDNDDHLAGIARVRKGVVKVGDELVPAI